MSYGASLQIPGTELVSGVTAASWQKGMEGEGREGLGRGRGEMGGNGEDRKERGVGTGKSRE